MIRFFSGFKSCKCDKPSQLGKKNQRGKVYFGWMFMPHPPGFSVKHGPVPFRQPSFQIGAPSLRTCVSFCVQIWRIENLELVPVEHQWYGFFYGGDCYLVLYTYEVNGKPRYILYIWQVGLTQAPPWDPDATSGPWAGARGSKDPVLTLSPLQGHHASKDELVASAYQATEVDQQFDGAPVQVRVTMGKEPRHFMAIFKGKLVIFEVRPLRKSDTRSRNTQTNKSAGGCSIGEEGWKPGWGAWVAQLVGRLPSAQVMIPGSWDQAPHRAPCSAGSLLLPLPLLLPLLVLSLSLSNK